MTEIKLYPFCGGKARIKSRQIEYCGEKCGQKLVKRSAYAVCNKCFSRGKPVTYEDYAGSRFAPPEVQEEVIDHWNRRV